MSEITWQNSDIVAKNPDSELRRRVWIVAQFLEAKDQRDEGELYGKGGELIEAADATVPTPHAGPYAPDAELP